MKNLLPTLFSFAKTSLKKVTKPFLFVALVFVLSHVTAQPTIQWQKPLGGTYWDEARSVRQTSDGGYIVAGWSDDGTGDNGNYDYWVIKFDGLGTLLWQKALGGSDWEEANDIKQTSDGGYIVAGYAESNDGNVTGNHGNDDYWIVKLNDSGSLQWQKSLGGSHVDEATAIQQTSDGGYIVAGRSRSTDGNVTGNHGFYDYWVVKLNGSGNLQWQKALGGSNGDEAYAIQQTSDGGYIVVGSSLSNDGNVTGNHGSSDYWVVKLDDSGFIQWHKALGGSNYDIAYSVQQTSDGGYVVAGYSQSNDGDVIGNHGETDYWIVKLDGSGNLQWQKALGGLGRDIANSIQQTSDGGYVVAGYSQSNDGDVTGNHGDNDYWVIKIDGSGNLQWQKALGGAGMDNANDIQQTSDGGYIVAGYSQSNGGDVPANNGESDYWIVKLADAESGTETMKPLQPIAVYPNPAAYQLTIDLRNLELREAGTIVSILDMQGRQLIEKIYTGLVGTLDVVSLSKGIYLLKVEHNGWQALQKLLIE